MFGTRQSNVSLEGGTHGDHESSEEDARQETDEADYGRRRLHYS